MKVLLGYPTVLNMLVAIKHIAAEIILARQHIIAFCMQHSRTLEKNTHFHALLLSYGFKKIKAEPH